MKRTEESINDFINARFKVCSNCGYNNYKGRLENYGTCLRCGEIIDERSYFKKKLGGELHGKKKRNSKRSSN